MSSLGLPQDRRLRQSGDFARIKIEGQRVVVGCLIVNWTPAVGRATRTSISPVAPAASAALPAGSLQPPGLGVALGVLNAPTPEGPSESLSETCPQPRPESRPPSSRVGVITSSRIGNAVVRSRARRLLREAFRLNQHAVHPPADLVIIARASIAKRGLPAVQRDFLEALRRARLLRRDAAPATLPKP